MTDTATPTVETSQAAREASGARPYGRYLEEFEVGAVYKHWPAKTITEADDHMFCLITMNHHPLHITERGCVPWGGGWVCPASAIRPATHQPATGASGLLGLTQLFRDGGGTLTDGGFAGRARAGGAARARGPTVGASHSEHPRRPAL